MTWSADISYTTIGTGLTPSTISELQQVYSQGFSDSTELVELKNDVTQIPRLTEVVVVLMLRYIMFAMLRTLWSSIKPKVALSLKLGEIRRISDKLIVEKTSDGKIVLYEVIE